MRDGKASTHWLLPYEDEPGMDTLLGLSPRSAGCLARKELLRSYGRHAGATKVNHRSGGIEVVNSQTDRVTFSDRQIGLRQRALALGQVSQLEIHGAKLDLTRRSDPGKAFP